MDLMKSGENVQTISISWDVPSMPNGIITVYEIHYTNNGSDTYNTTNTQYTIGGLLPNTSYTIEVRAYTSIGGGEWMSITTSTNSIRMLINDIIHYCILLYSYCIRSVSYTHLTLPTKA